MRQLSVLLIGTRQHPEFRETIDWLARQTRLAFAADVDEAAARLLDADIAPNILILAQKWPGQFSTGDIDGLQRLAPLARLAAILGSWCEGEGRSRRPTPGVIRGYWHHWLPRCAKELERFVDEACPSWGLPLTASEDERLLYTAVEPLPRRQGLIVIHAQFVETADALGDACRAAGYATVWLKPGHNPMVKGAAAVIWDGNCCDAAQAESIRQLAHVTNSAPIVALLNFPRSQDCERALTAGAACVISKPYRLDDLFWRLDQVLGTSSTGRVAASVA